jgi:hypothetical protein
MSPRPDPSPDAGDLPTGIGRTATRELAAHGISSLEQVAAHTAEELLAIHGVGPKAVRVLDDALATRGLHLRAAPAAQRHAAPSPSTPRIFRMAMADVHPAYVAKAERKGRTRTEVDRIIRWQTGYTQPQLRRHLAAGTDMATFFASAPEPNPDRSLVTGVVCGVRVEDVADPTMREIRILDKLVDELARGRPMERILGS